MARKFLYLVAVATILVLVGAFALNYFSDGLSKAAFVPTEEFQEQEELAENIYAEASMWYSKPGMDAATNPSMWLPEGIESEPSEKSAVFFLHPTSYMTREHWNAPLGDEEAEGRAKIFLRGQASAFNHVGEIWAPKYRQATIGAFLTEKPEGQLAIGAAFQDVLLAFGQFLEEVPADKPIILAGHSQGALHLTRLLHHRIAQDPDLAKRIAAVYVIGWPVSIEADLPAFPLPACETAEQAGCILSWQSYAEPADFGQFTKLYDLTQGFTGEARAGTNIICTNPINGDLSSSAEASENLGTMVPDAELKNAEIVAGVVPARCDERGFLLIGDPPDLGPYVLPGNNYHVYDYSLFWMNMRADIRRRLDTFLSQ